MWVLRIGRDEVKIGLVASGSSFEGALQHGRDWSDEPGDVGKSEGGIDEAIPLGEGTGYFQSTEGSRCSREQEGLRLEGLTEREEQKERLRLVRPAAHDQKSDASRQSASNLIAAFRLEGNRNQFCLMAPSYCSRCTELIRAS